jgi:hypothetical protein
VLQLRTKPQHALRCEDLFNTSTCAKHRRNMVPMSIDSTDFVAIPLLCTSGVRCFACTVNGCIWFMHAVIMRSSKQLSTCSQISPSLKQVLQYAVSAVLCTSQAIVNKADPDPLKWALSVAKPTPFYRVLPFPRSTSIISRHSSYQNVVPSN